MRHYNSGKKLGRTPAHRKALFRNLAKALITYGSIKTTEVKAKELRRIVEPLITLSKRNDLHSRRLAYEALGSHSLVKKLFDELGPKFEGIAGGYTRITKLPLPRIGDSASMAKIEFIGLDDRKNAEKDSANTKKTVQAKPQKQEAEKKTVQAENTEEGSQKA